MTQSLLYTLIQVKSAIVKLLCRKAARGYEKWSDKVKKKLILLPTCKSLVLIRILDLFSALVGKF